MNINSSNDVLYLGRGCYEKTYVSDDLDRLVYW